MYWSENRVMNTSDLTNFQLNQIITFVHEDHGSSLNVDQFRNVILGYFDNISGLETLSDSELECHINKLTRLYFR